MFHHSVRPAELSGKAEINTQAINPKFAERRDVPLVAQKGISASLRDKMGWRRGAMCLGRPKNEGAASSRLSGCVAGDYFGRFTSSATHRIQESMWSVSSSGRGRGIIISGAMQSGSTERSGSRPDQAVEWL